MLYKYILSKNTSHITCRFLYLRLLFITTMWQKLFTLLYTLNKIFKKYVLNNINSFCYKSPHKIDFITTLKNRHYCLTSYYIFSLPTKIFSRKFLMEKLLEMKYSAFKITNMEGKLWVKQTDNIVKTCILESLIPNSVVLIWWNFSIFDDFPNKLYI